LCGAACGDDVHREHYDARFRAPLAYHPGRFDPIHPGHDLRQDRDVGPDVEAGAHSIEAAAGEGDHVHIALRVDQTSQTLGNDPMTVSVDTKNVPELSR